MLKFLFCEDDGTFRLKLAKDDSKLFNDARL